MSLTTAFAVIAQSDGSTTTVTTGTFSSVGYTHVVAFGKCEGASTTFTFSDNKSSTFSNLTLVDHTNTDLHSRMAWAPIGSPGTGHTVTLTLGGARSWKRLGVWLVNATGGTIEVDVEATAQGSGTAIDAGSLATTAATASFMGVGEYSTPTYTPSAGWTEDWDSSWFGASRTDASGTLDPAVTGSLSMDWTCHAVSFKEPSVGAGQTHKLMLTGVGF